MKAVKEGPIGGPGLGLLRLVLLLECVDPVLALNLRLVWLDTVFTAVNGGSDFLPVGQTEVSAVEADVTVAPRRDQRLGGAVAPAVLSGGAVHGVLSGRVGIWVRIGGEDGRGLRGERSIGFGPVRVQGKVGAGRAL